MNKRLITHTAILSLSALLFAASAMAQPPRDKGPGGEMHHGPRGAEQQLAWLDQALELSDEQSAELLAALQANEAERQALHQRMMEEFRPEVCALAQDADADILAILTPEQAEDYLQIREERRQRKDAGRGRRLADFDCEAIADES